MTVLIATPVILPPRDDVLKSWDYWAHLIIVNGAFEQWSVLQNEDRWSLVQGENRGVAWSWNRAFGFAKHSGFEYVALLSQNCVLHEGTANLAAQVELHADWRGLLTDQAFHAVAFSVDLWERFGGFDEAFRPGYFEDVDAVRRLELLGLHTAVNPMPKIELSATCDTAAAYKAGYVTSDQYAANGALYRAKWGGDRYNETFDHPYNDPTLPLTFTGDLVSHA